MKKFLCLLLAVYTAAAVPLANLKDNIHFTDFSYDDGEAWQMEDIEEQSNMNSLSEVSRNPNDNRYLLYTRRNSEASQTLRLGNSNSITLSTFNVNNPVVVIVHGWFGNQHTDFNIVLKDTFLAKSDVNIIVMEWRRLASSDYVRAVAGVPAVGRGLGQFLKFLNSVTGVSFENMHLVGFSLGAHIVGNAGRELNGAVARITGLDPAGPLWNLNSNRLRASDAIYVEAIHTNGGTLGLGIGTAIADADFFANGGNNQPGCLTPICSHNRAWEFFGASVSYNHLLGRKCSNMLQVTLNSCRGEVLNMGNDDFNKKGTGIYRVSTQRSYPY